MKAFAWMVGLGWALQAAQAGTTLVLDPGPGSIYLGVSCGGQAVNEIATGFDAASGNALTLVKVSTTCHGSGRGSPNQYYLACWTVGFARDGSIASQLWLATNHWQQGQPSIPCPVPGDPAAVYTATDGAGNFPATLSSALVGSGGTERAVLETTCDAVHYGDTVAGNIGAPGASACDSFSGEAGNGVRVSAAATSGNLVPFVDLRRPDGSVVCSGAGGEADCSLDTTGLHTVLLRDAGGSGSGDYLLSLTRTDVPRLTIAMTATLTAGRRTSQLGYRITVGNAGGAAATGVVVTDALPKGLSVRSLATTQGSCTRSQRNVSCALGDLAAGATAVVDIGTSTGLSSGEITNPACVEANNCATTTTNLP